MPDHLSDEQITAFRTRTLGPADLLTVDDHVAACEVCRRKLLEDAGVERAFRALHADIEAGATPTHLSYEQIERYIDGGSDEVEREITETHLEECARCADEAKDLRELRAKRTPLKTTRRPTFPAPIFRWLLLPAAAVLVWAATLVFRGDGRPVSEPTGPTQAVKQASPAPAAVRFALDDGGRRVTLDDKGRLAGLPALSAEHEASVRVALETGRLETPAFLTGLVGKPGTLLGPTAERDTLKLVGPLGTAVETDQPTLRWRPLAGAASYTAAVFDTRLNPVAMSPTLSATEWTVPKSLERGRDYSWQVIAVKERREITAPAPPAPEARFRVLEQSLADETHRARQAYAGSHLALGLLYARVGLLHEAERELQALASANPESPVARELLEQVQALRAGQFASPMTTNPAQ